MTTFMPAPKPPKREKKPRKPIPHRSPKKIAADAEAKPKKKVGTTSGMMRRSTVKRKPRSADETLRIYGPVEFRDWLHDQPCAA